ncbi:glycosyltransferase family 4 protein [Calothrix rhizosoleniae]|uniref:glycosyltransferase family 4 protein n=1 Tax=Calothrix rhizosoleniae TaxID=888997 RepID=UPI000B4A0A4C|nr:glycosyltransferase family 4 protein [Calothrix rhizosoleniae]
MRVAYITTYDARDIANWSGIGFYMAQSLKEQSIQVDLIGSVRNKYSPLSILFKSKEYLYKYLLNQNYLHYREPALLRNYANQAAKQLSQLEADIVLSPGSIPIAYLECSQPIVFWTDATFAGMIDFYPEFSNLCQESIRNQNAMEQSALDRCKLAIYSSEWAAKTAIENYKVDPNKVKVVPFGANIECQRNIDDIKVLVESRPSDKCKLLFLGVNWLRKGGNIAFQVAKELNSSGLETELTIVGCPPMVDEPLPNFIRSLGFISKSTKEGREQIDRLIAESHFLILPSIADCTPLVFCEANSFGVPCLSTKLGGIPTIVRDNVNGKLFNQESDISEYCQYISSLFVRYSEYKKLAMSAFDEYQSRLNWSVAGKTVKEMLRSI